MAITLPTLDDTTKKYLAYGITAVAVGLIITGIFVPSAKEYLANSAKMLLAVVGFSAQ